MKLKKLLISASAIAAGSGLLATVLTSCSKASIDDKLKIELNDNGLLYNPGNMGDGNKLDYKDAIKMALTRSSNWIQFKNALADEIVFKWYENRMSTTKEADDKNTNFRVSYDEWKYQIDKDYNDTIQNCKNKYGANWEFYFQNEYLAPLGGTEESYKHAKLVEKVKADFVSKVFAKSYFGMRAKDDSPAVYPHIYRKATKNIDRYELRNNANWDRLGFFARAEVSFYVETVPTSYEEVSPSWLAKHPDGDYAAIQDFVFNRWFRTEKPFFADAALFKYSNPKRVASGKLDEVYDATFTEVKLPTDKPSEAFPFFGAGDDCSTAKAVRFIQDLQDGKFATLNKPDEKTIGNGTVTIPLADSDDGQTCLLVCGNQMFTSLFTPYAMACGNLYDQMVNPAGATNKSKNILSASRVIDNFKVGEYTGEKDDFRILSNFFYDELPDVTDPEKIGSYLDLNAIYGGEGQDGSYHCPLFKNCQTYDWFYGHDGSNKGIRYLTNFVEVDDFKSTTDTLTPAQPWVMELNEAGVHILTIDGFNYVQSAGNDEKARLANLKKAVMYRLMQKQNNDIAAGCISTDLLGESGKLKTYFNDNFANIILEMATYNATEGTEEEKTENNAKYNIFRTVESYKTTDPKTEENLFLNKIWKEQSLGTAYANLTKYLEALDQFEEVKKNVSTLETANNKIYSYRSKQITNVKSTGQYSKALFENGLLTPFAYEAINTPGNKWTYDYASVNRLIIQGNDKAAIIQDATSYIDSLLANKIEGSDYVKEAITAPINDTNNGFSPQISTAKSKTSNRFWYKSPLVDKFMYAFMGNKSNTANAIKKNAYDYYITKNNPDDWFTPDSGHIWKGKSSADALATTYKKSKLLTGDKNLASYANNADEVKDAAGFYKTMNDCFDLYLYKAWNENGQNADDILNYHLWVATVAYLIASDKTEGAQRFDNFYTVLNSKIGEDETAIVGYLARGYTYGAGKLTDEQIKIMSEVEKSDYEYDANVDNLFDKDDYAGKGTPSTGLPTDSKLSTSSYWNVTQRKYAGDAEARDFNGFLGLQTKSSNQLDSTSGLQTAVFNNFARSTFEAYNVDATTETKYQQNHGCWFQFAGSKDANGKDIELPALKDQDINSWFTDEFVVVRKLAKKIREYGTMDDLRSLAKLLTDSFDGHSDFAGIADGSSTFDNTDDMRMAMLELLPSKHADAERKETLRYFQRVSNAEARTTDNTQSVVFKDNKGKNSYKLLMTQMNKADVIERTITPDWDTTTSDWKMPTNSPLTAEEFWIILFNMASESTVQQRAVTEIVKTAFGDNKLIVYDAQLYNEFDSIWIKDWAKKTLGA